MAEELGIPNFSVETFPGTNMKKMKEGESRIINISTQEGQVGHWCLAVRRDGERYYFDSFACVPPDQVRRILGGPYQGSDHQVQKIDSSECGIKCMYVCYNLALGHGFVTVLDEMEK